jgi:hypothetical protein
MAMPPNTVQANDRPMPLGVADAPAAIATRIAKGDGGRSVIQKAFRLDQSRESWLDLRFAKCGDDRNGIGSGNQRAKQRGGEPSPAQQQMRSRGDHSGRYHYAGNGEQHGDRQIPHEIPPLQVQCGFKDQGRKKDREYEFAAERNAKAEGRQRERDTSEYQPHAIGQVHAPRDHCDE